MTFQTIRLEVENEILTLTVARPEKLNALNRIVFLEIQAALEEIRCGDHGSILGMILAGEKSKAFIAGADIGQMSQMTPEQGAEFAGLAQSITLEIERLPWPVIATVDGFALGGGCEMALACDFIFATDAAVFGQPEVKLGLIPGFGGCVRLKDRVGLGAAKRIIYSGKPVLAREALELGLCDQIFATREEMLAGACDFLKDIAENSIEAVGLCKKVINQTMGQETPNALEIEKQSFFEVFQTANKEIGVSAFLKKEKARFQNSRIPILVSGTENRSDPHPVPEADLEH
jgi:enoyl-CoA hydratase